MKKAQLMNHPFYYIFVVIVIALIFIFGFRMISNLIKLQEQGKFVEFKVELKKAVDNVYVQNPGTKISFLLTFPKDAKEVCFEKFNTYSKLSSDSKYFISFNMDNLTHNKQNPYCIKIKNQQLSFALENKILNDKTVVEIL